MSNLPQVTVPNYERVLPSGEKVTIRPFLVDEEMILLQAMETGEEKQIRTSVMQVVNNCLVKPDKNAATMAWFDVDFLLVLLRGYSVGTDFDIKFTCNNLVDNGGDDLEECGHDFTVTYDIEDLSFEKPYEADSTIFLREKMGVKMKYPSYGSIREGLQEFKDDKQAFDLICDSIESIFDENAVYPVTSMTRLELEQWVGKLMSQDMKKMYEFINSAPYMMFKKKATCPSCGFEHELRYENFSDFFI